MYDGVPVVLEADWRRSVNASEVDRALEKNKDVSVVTLVHCDTPSWLPVHCPGFSLNLLIWFGGSLEAAG